MVILTRMADGCTPEVIFYLLVQRMSTPYCNNPTLPKTFALYTLQDNLKKFLSEKVATISLLLPQICTLFWVHSRFAPIS
jgi:hypothetical protein